MKKPSLPDLICMTCAGSAGGIALINVFRRIFETSAALDASFFQPIGYNRAVCFIAASIALLLMHRFRHVGSVAGIGIFLFGSLTAVLFVPGADGFFQPILSQLPEMFNGPGWGRMALSTSSAVMLLGIALFLCARPGIVENWRALLVAVAGSIVAALGVLPLLDLFAYISVGTSWQQFTHMRFGTALCFILFGIGIMSYIHGRTRAFLWIPISTCIGFLVVTLSLYAAVHHQETAKIDNLLQAEGSKIAAKIDLQLGSIHGSLNRMARRWVIAGGFPLPQWEDDAIQYTTDYSSLVALSLTDSDMRIVDIVPKSAAMDRFIGFKLDSDPVRAAVIADVMATQAPQSSHVIELKNGNKGFLYINPLMKQGAFDGLLIAGIETGRLAQKVFSDPAEQDFAVTLTENGAEVYINQPFDKSLVGQWHQTVKADSEGMNWAIEVEPTRNFLSSHETFLDTAVLIIGIFAAVLISLCVYFAIKWHDQHRKLQNAEKLNNTILLNAGAFIIATDLSGIVIGYNPAAEKALGYEAAEIVGKQTPAIWHMIEEVEARAAELSEKLGQEIKPGFDVFTAKPRLLGSETRDWTYRRKNGSSFVASLTATPLRDEQGEITGYMGISHDVTLQKEQQGALKASEEIFRTAMENAPIGMALVSPEGAFLRVNRALCTMLGFDPVEMTRINFQAITHPDDLDLNEKLKNDVLAGLSPAYEMEKRYIHKSGKLVWAFLSVSLARKPDGRPDYFVSQMHDITERKQVEILKDEFVSVVSHELRTPLTSIRGSLGLIAGVMSKDLPPQIAHLISIAHKNSERLILLINDILDIDQIAAGKMRFDMKREFVGPLLVQAIDANKAYAERFNIDIKLTAVPADLMINVDSARVTQVMSNLLSNAAKFSNPHTAIHVFVYKRENFVRINVQDTGPGIPLEFQSRIFGKFLQADSSVRREKGGTGLGLHITREMVRHMGGQVGFESTTDRGTIFWVEFADAGDLPYLDFVAPETAARAGRILICEDDFDVAAVLKMHVEKPGFSADVALSIADAREQLKVKPYRAIILDLAFPKENGIDFIRELRANPITVDLPVVVVSARADESREKLDGEAFGVVDWLSKPIDPKKLSAALARATRRRGTIKPRVLHVEDDVDLSKILATALSENAEIINVPSLREAKEQLASEQFALVILDIVLPDGNGLALLGGIRDLSGRPVPVLILSAEEAPPDSQVRVASAMVKSRMSETKIIETILSLIHTHGDSNYVD